MTATRIRRGFSLVELLVVITIVTMLLTLLLPSLNKAREAGRAVVCSNNLHGIMIATTDYAYDSQQWTVHGQDLSHWWGPSAYGYSFYYTNAFCDDWSDGTPGIPGRNIATNGAPNYPGVGVLMYNYYLPERADGLCCPQSDFREPFNASGGVNSYNTKGMKASLAATGGNYWRNDLYIAGSGGNPSYRYYGTSYVVRGPLMRMDALSNANKVAMFTDQEQASQAIISSIAVNTSPLPFGWGRVHTEGFYVGYIDGSVALFGDFDRHLTYWANQCRFYGNGDPLMNGFYDRK